jgi:NADH:ubiquinone oxidoreductase subunit 3 (subunit A)
MHNKTLIIIALIALAALPALYTATAAPTINLNLYKNNGYGMGQDIAGQWTLNTETSSDVIKVEFYLDDQLQQADDTAPFSWQFNTNNYTIGTHTLKAVAYNAAAESQTATLQRNFVEDNTSNILVIIIVIAAIVVALSVVVALYRIKKNKR